MRATLAVISWRWAGLSSYYPSVRTVCCVSRNYTVPMLKDESRICQRFGIGTLGPHASELFKQSILAWCCSTASLSSSAFERSSSTSLRTTPIAFFTKTSCLRS